MEYCHRLVHEYSILEQAQIYRFLRVIGHVERSKARDKIVRRLKEQWNIHELTYGGRKHIASRPDILPVRRYKGQIACFWVLMEYIERIDSHYATGTFSRISMEIGARDYNIVYVEPGQERLCVANIAQGGDTKYIVVVQGKEQIPLITGDKIHIFAIVSPHGETEYYEVKE